MPLSQAISDTDCIMREYNQLTAAGSYGERMILNRNQYKLNLTLSLAELRGKPGAGDIRGCQQHSVPSQQPREDGSSSSSPHPVALLFAFHFFPSPGCCLQAEWRWKGEAAGGRGDAIGTVAVPARVGHHQVTKQLGTVLLGSGRSPALHWDLESWRERSRRRWGAHGSCNLALC